MIHDLMKAKVKGVNTPKMLDLRLRVSKSQKAGREMNDKLTPDRKRT